MECASKLAEKVIDVGWDLTFRHVGYIVNYKENVGELDRLVDDLKNERVRVENRVREAENNLETIEDVVRKWFDKVDETTEETEKLKEDEGRTETGCSSGILPYLWNRHKLGRKAKKKAVDVRLLINESKFDRVSIEESPTSMDTALSNVDYQEFGSRKNTMEEIMKKLEDSTVRMIGVHGPGGVGKSTFIKEIAKQVKDKFKKVIVVDVTENPDLPKIQKEIAYVLGIRSIGEVETVSADRLRRGFKKWKESTLIILDDLWDRFDLNKIGISFDDENDDDADISHLTTTDMKDLRKGKSEDDDDISHITIKDMKDPIFKMARKGKSPGDHNGCKILLTSRDKNVLSDKMDVKSIFRVGELEDKESLMLFQKVAKMPDEMSESKQEIVKYCAGLPMAIVMVGRALRNMSESVWKSTLEKLKKEKLNRVHQSMEVSVKMSYEHLESEELKSIFLLCAQMGRQQLIMDLVNYCFGLGILEGIYTIREAQVRILTSIQKLKNLSFMLDASSNDLFDMHDMVRDAALSIAHREQNVFALRNGKLDDWHELEKCTAISIRNCDIIDELPNDISCPHLKFFEIESGDPSLKIPNTFFGRMKKLRVLKLSGFNLPFLPSSVECLVNLRMLCLERCILLDNLSIIGELKKLKILSFSGSQIENFPAELGCLDKLQFFDISSCSIVKVVLPNFISRLICLEELYIRKSLIKMEVDEETKQSQLSFLSQLKHLHQLNVVDLYISSAAVLPRDLFFDRLNDYKIVIGDFNMLSVGDFRMPNKYEASRSLALRLTDGIDIHSQTGIKLLFKRVENLLLGELNGVQNVFCELNVDGFPDLKHLSIVNNIGIEYIFNSTELSHPQNAFPNLESLFLYKLRSIKTICYTPVTEASFTKLKTIRVKKCTQLKNLFSFYVVKFLVSLETIDVSECDSLEEILVKEGQASSNKVEFHKLRTLTLQSLPSITSFYANVEMPSEEDDHTEITLFGVLVEIPNLESLELSSISSHKIWSDQRLSSSWLQNLIKLTVKDCHNLRYLCSLSVASNMKKLKILFISECGMMERIFITEGNNEEKVCVFPKLEEIHLTQMKMLTNIWPAEMGAHSFSSLISVQIEKCQTLDKIFPSHLTGWFRSLERLKVVSCLSLEFIFEIEDSQKKDASGSAIDTKLKLIHVKDLKNLMQIWCRDPGGILSFKNLQSIWVQYCHKLTYVLPASVAHDLNSLQSISVKSCGKMEEIVAWADGSETPLKFPEVNRVQLFDLSIRHFYRGGHIECPKLKQLLVIRCKKLETFTTEIKERKPGFYAEKVISNLELMEIDSKDVGWLQRNHGKYLMHRIKELSVYSLRSIESLYWLLHRMPNLESLTLLFNEEIKELVAPRNIVPQERLGTILQLKKLTLWGSLIRNLGFERDPVRQRLEHLMLLKCDNLIKLAPSSVSLTHLTHLELISCNRLRNLITSSTARSMVQLRNMKVSSCYKLKEIVTHDENEEGGVIVVVFSKLISIELVRLENLTSFCSYKNCEFKFPSLERLSVRECPKLEKFTESHTTLTTTPKLQSILVIQGPEEEGYWPELKGYWEGDLNATIHKVFKDTVSFKHREDLLFFGDHEMLERVCHQNHMVHESMFFNLKTLKISWRDNLVHAISSHLLPCFGNLEELEVSNCWEVQVIFNINDMRVTEALRTFRLKKLTLMNLPNLKHIWDKDPIGIFCLPMLQEINVENCDTLKSLFPASMAKDLTRLEMLNVINCKELVDVFSKDEISANGATKEFVFPCLTSLELIQLPALRHFYPGLHKIECPTLQELLALHSELVIVRCQEDRPADQALIQIEKAIQIPFGIGDTGVAWRYGKLQIKRLQRFQEESDSVLYNFIVMLPNIEKLELIQGSCEEIFSAERPNGNETRVLLCLKELLLVDLDNLKSIGLEHSWLHPIPENLQILKVESCGHLISLVPHTVSFSNLTHLHVIACKRLLYLLTSSTAKSLCQLKEMRIERCESMQNIVSTDQGEETDEDENVILGQLLNLFLYELPELTCFYSGNLSLCFPSLVKVSVIRCREMKTFCPFNKIDPTKLSSGITFMADDDAGTTQWEGDLNSTLCKKFEEEEFQMATSSSFDMIKDLNDSKLVWKIAVRIVRIWYIQKTPKPGHLEMILMDSKGDKIQVAVKNDEFREWNERLKENTTYVIHNFMLLPNGLQFKSCEHPYRMQFTYGTTTLIEKDFPEIPFFEYQFKSFSDILAGKYQPDLLVDVIGFVDEIMYSQPPATSNKVMFKMKDLSGDGICCTLWDDYAMKFLDYNHQKQTDCPIIIMLTNARINKPKGKYPASISNSYYGTKLFINDDIPEIQTFKISLGANEQDGFMFDACVKSISEIVGISSSEEVTCVTVGTTAMFIIGEEGWYYEGCMKCTKRADVPNVPYQCTAPECLNYNERTIPRYKLDIKVVHKQGSAKFVFWDHQCAEIIGMTALKLRDRMLQEGEDDPKAYPQQLDLMLTRTMAFRVKVQSVYNQSSVNKFSEDRQLIKRILDQIESTQGQETSKTDKGKSVAIDSVQFDNQSLSAMKDHDPDNLLPITPANRMSTIPEIDQVLGTEL